MNFDFGGVLSRAWQITWRHKVLWIIAVLPFSTMLLFLPFWLVYVFMSDFEPETAFRLFDDQSFATLAILVYLLFFAASIFLQILSQSSATLGIYRIEAGIHITFRDLLKDGFQYFWRILGVVFLITAAVIVFFIAFSVVTALLSAVTLGLAAFCLQPLFILIIPLFFLVAAAMEQAEAAVVADGMGAPGAVRQAYELMKANFGKYVLTTLVVYIGTTILVDLVVLPFTVPMFFLMMHNMETGMNFGNNFSNIVRMQAAFSVVLFPILILAQGITLTYIKSAMIIMYLRLTRFSTRSQPVLQGVTA